MELSYALPLLGAVFYTLATFFIKRGLAFGGGAMRVVFISNIMAMPLFLPMLYLGDGGVVDWSFSWAVLLSALGNFAGLILTFVAVRVGDLSVQTPIMGSKVMIVGGLAVLLGTGPIPLQWWLGAGLSVVAIYILSKPENLRQKRSRQLVITILLSLASAVCFALCDVVMDKYASSFGEGPFAVGVIVATGILSFSLIPFFEGSFRSIPKCSWPWFLTGNFLMTLEALCFYGSISFFGNATAANILYSSRGIWSVVLVCLLGGFFGNAEGAMPRNVLIRRFVGSFLLFVAIILVLTT